MNPLLKGILWLIVAIGGTGFFAYPVLMMIADHDYDLIIKFSLNLLLGAIIIGFAIYIGVVNLRAWKRE
jgi:hypothetical protein